MIDRPAPTCFTSFSLIALLLLNFFAPVSNAEDLEPLKIGIIFPLSGKEARQGALGRIGVDLALSSFKSSFTPKIFVEDSQSEARHAVTAFNKLVSADNIDAILTMGSPTAMALLPLANRHKRVLMSMAVASGYSVADDFGFRLMGTAPQFGGRMIEMLLSELKLKRIALINSEDDYGTAYERYLTSELKSHAAFAGSESYVPGTTDFRPSLLRLKTHAPDAIILACWARDAGLILRQSKELGLKPKLFACPGACDNPDLITSGADATERVVVVASSNKTTAELKDQLTRDFNETPTSVVLRFYDAIAMLREAAQLCNGVELPRSECLKMTLSKIKDLPGSSFPLSFDSYGDIRDHFELKAIEAGRFLVVDSSNMKRNFPSLLPDSLFSPKERL